MKGPAGVERLLQVAVSRTVSPDSFRDDSGARHTRGSSARRLNCLREESNLLISCRAHHKVYEPPLNLCPLIAQFARKPLGVFIERLMKNPDQEKASAASGGSLRQLLQQIDVHPVLSR